MRFTRLPKLAILFSVTTMIGSCGQHYTGDYHYVPGAHAQRLSPGTSVIGEACDGHDPNLGMNVRGPSLLFAHIDIRQVVNGAEYPWGVAASPVDFVPSQMPGERFDRIPGPPACYGAALKTRLLVQDHSFRLEYDMEIAPPYGDGGLALPADAWRVQGTTPVSLSGTATQQFGFVAFGTSFVAHVAVTPGSLWRADPVVRNVRRDPPPVQAQTWAQPLPDEMPYRTLRDATVPEYRDSTFPAEH